jgi:hypothetical protein
LVAGAARGPGAEDIVLGLAQAIARLQQGSVLTIAEFSPVRMTVWKIRIDGIGVPRVVQSGNDWHSLRAFGALDEAELLDRIRSADDGALFLARTGPGPAAEGDQDGLDADEAFRIGKRRFPGARAFRSSPSVDDLLEDATARVPLPSSLWYELVLLRCRRSGRLEFTAEQLFLPEARRGDTRPFTIRCEPSDENGTVFAVAARDAAFEFQLVSMASAKVPPGTYQLTATLLRPGRVRFDGLPVKLRPDLRNWLDVLAQVPERLDVHGPAHLIVAVECCGTDAEVEARIDRARQLIDTVNDTADGPVTFSLLTFAAHAHNRMSREDPVTAVDWAQSDPRELIPRLQALHARRGAERARRNEEHIRRGEAPELQYPRAARIECMLAEVGRLLKGAESAGTGRPALVTIGARPAHPYRIDPVSEILPCPDRRDWRIILPRLAQEHAGMAFGAIRDAPDDLDDFHENPLDEVWDHLGTDMKAGTDAFDAHAFAVGLGLVPPALQYLPFPLAISDGAD